MKKFLTTILALCMLFSLGAVAHADEHDHDVANGVGEQIKFLAGRFADLEQKGDGNTWYYAVSDLDHNGRLELLATTRTPGDMSWLKVWEIGPDGKTLTKCTEHSIPAPIGSTEETITAEGMLLNLRSNSTDTYYDKGSNTYYYLFTDVAEGNGKRLFLPGSSEQIEVGSYVTTGVGAASLKDGSMQNSIILGSCTSYSVDDGDLKVICRNGKLEEITLQEFLDISLNASKGLAHFSTAFDWFTADEAGLLQRFVDSYAVFDGVRDMDNAEGGVAFMASQSAGGVYITKNPTDEKLNDGQTAEFIAEASIYDDVTWTFIAPDGRTYNEQEFVRMCGGIPEGTKTGYLRIKNVNTDMNGWGVFATFDYRGVSARSSTAYFYVWSGGSTSLGAGEAIDAFYRDRPWLNAGGWTCPKCGGWANGSECWSCGFNPVAFYAVYYGVAPSGYDWYYGVDGQTTVNQIREAYQGAELRLCDYCGQWFNNDYDVCPYCGGAPDDGTLYTQAEYNTYIEYLQGADMRLCDYCGQWFNNDYDVCPHCGGAPDDGTLYTQAEYNTYNEYLQGADMRLCKYCGQWFNNDYDVCPHCGGAPDDGYADNGAFEGFTAGGNARFSYYNDDGSTYETVICPYCGYEHSMATYCPNCGGGYD